ncbi:MAG TPA: TetR family transcriptional regulator [Caulobacteraceae bacterium]|nr:TetR family transcriptional regulator [Caulobacteraceae bacterium]
MSADASRKETELSPRRPRADSARNRERLILAARTAFAGDGAEASLEDIARSAHVGIGTLYRHFPSRLDLLEAVYRREVEQLAQAAPRLLAERPPFEALREWMRLSIDYLATKRVIAPALAASAGAPQIYAASGGLITGAMTQLVESAVRSGEIRPDTDPGDLLRAMVGLSYGYTEPGWEASARRLVDILMDGLRPPGR